MLTEEIDGKRHYVTPNGKFPSITSVLGAFPKPGLVAWRNRVGDEEAARISKMATSRGSKVHKLCEDYLTNNPIDKTTMPDALSMFYSIQPILENINNIHHLEAPLYSPKLKIGGRVDCIAEYNNVLSIIDFKTSRKEKNEAWITDYYYQCCFYAAAYYELTGIPVNNLVIIIAVENDNPQIFIKKTKDFIKPLLKVVRDYYILYH